MQVYGDGYWLKDNGNNIIDIIQIKYTKHIDVVNDNPEKFGLDKSFIQSVYDKYNEPYGMEGKQREEIILQIYNLGWIRIREYDNYNKIKNIIKKFVEEYIVYGKILKLFEKQKKRFPNRTFSEYINGIDIYLKINDLNGYNQNINVYEYQKSNNILCVIII